MQDTKHTSPVTLPVSSRLPAEYQDENVLPPPGKKTLRKRLFRAVQHYPLPLIAVVLLLVSLIFWLVGHGDMARWTLLTIVLVGGLPLLWETGLQFLHRAFGVDVIAVLAIIGSLLLQQYLAGALIVLMLSGGEASGLVWGWVPLRCCSLPLASLLRRLVLFCRKASMCLLF